MRGTIVIDNQAGRALRKQPGAVRAADVVYFSGAFRKGDSVYISFRGADGGQYVIGSGPARCDESALRALIGDSVVFGSRERTIDARLDDVVIRAEDIILLWPSSAV